MITWIKSWFVPPILQFGIVECPVCKRNLKKQFSIFQKRRCEMIYHWNDIFTFVCGRCEGRSQWCGSLEDQKPFTYLRITAPHNRMIHSDLIELAQDSQARYNIKLIQMGQHSTRPDRCNFFQYTRKELLNYIKRIESRTKNIKIIK